MAATAKYAVVSKARLAILDFTDNPASIQTEFNYLIDMEGHPQADVVTVDWYYDEATNTFRETEEITPVFIYAVTDTYGICTGIEVANAESTAANHILVPAVDTAMIGLAYAGNAFRTLEEATYILLKEHTTATAN